MDSVPNSISINRLKHYPIMMFTIVMGIEGLTIAYQKATKLIGFSEITGYTLMYISLILFVIISAIYIIKLVKYPKVVMNEWNHPIRINFFATISISMVMLAIITHNDFHLLSSILWYSGTAMHTFITLYIISFWINRNQDITHSNPAWFIPIVGNVLIPVGGVGLVSKMVLIYYFSVGVFFWIILFAIVMNRIIFHHQLAQKFMPTLFILLAPPAVTFIAYFKITESIDLFAHFVYSIALFFTFMLAFMFRQFLGLKFFISWWAFIFPLAAMSIASMIMYKQMNDNFLLYIAYGMIIITTLMSFIVIFQTIKHMLNKEICIQE